jgi:hypothetical protein
LVEQRPPGQLDQVSAQPPIARLGEQARPAHTALRAKRRGSRRRLAAAQPGVATHLPAVLKPIPSGHFRLDRLLGQPAHALGQHLGRSGLDSCPPTLFAPQTGRQRPPRWAKIAANEGVDAQAGS